MYTGTRYDENPEVPEEISEDNGGEWQGEFKELLEKQGVKILPGLPYVSETDSVIEAFNKEFEASVECLLIAAGAPYSMWSWAGRHDCFNRARLPDGWPNGGMDEITTELWFRGIVRQSI